MSVGAGAAASRDRVLPDSPPADPHGIEVRIEVLPEIEALGVAWRELEARSDASFFLSWHWIGCWLVALGDATSRLRLLVARDAAGRIVGLAILGPAIVRRHRVLRVRTLHLNQTGDEREDVVTIEYNDVLADKLLASRVRHACLAFLVATERIGRWRVDAIAWRGAEEELLRDLLAGVRLPWRFTAEAPSAAVDLAAIRASGGSFLEHVSRNTRRQLRRSMALYEERLGPLRLEPARDAEEGLRFFRAAGELHQARWVPRGEPGAFAFPFYVRFHERLIREALPAGAAELVRVSAGREPIGYVYNFLHGGRVYHYFSGFRYDLGGDNRLRPGMVVHTLCIERHLARGMDLYDFMAGDNRYKTSLGRPGPRIVGVVMERPRLMLRLEDALRRVKHRLARGEPLTGPPATTAGRTLEPYRIRNASARRCTDVEQRLGKGHRPCVAS